MRPFVRKSLKGIVVDELPDPTASAGHEVARIVACAPVLTRTRGRVGVVTLGNHGRPHRVGRHW